MIPRDEYEARLRALELAADAADRPRNVVELAHQFFGFLTGQESVPIAAVLTPVPGTPETH